MKEIEFSVMEGYASDANYLLPLLEAFEKEHHIHVNLIAIPWATAWAQNVKYALYGHGPDVSAVGSAWVGSLASMQALRPFTPQEVQALGGAEAYFKAIWQTGQLLSHPATWAIPWHGDVRILYYWKDLLKAAGLENFEEAFKTDSALVETLEKLQKAGYQSPLAITTQAIAQVLHEAAHWVWNAGGDFMSRDGKWVTFNQSEALTGFKNYFGLLPYVSPNTQQINSGDLFHARTSPIHIAGLWVPDYLTRVELKDQLGVAQLPRIGYTGGTSFVIWQYTLKERQAFELIQFLASQPPFDNRNLQRYNRLPTRREALNAPLAQNDPFNRTFLQAFQSGRSFPAMRLWGSIQDKLISEVAQIWAELFSNPDQDLETCLHKHLDPLAARLNAVLGN
jgi:multiple sugar transport system substrate-binding protein